MSTLQQMDKRPQISALSLFHNLRQCFLLMLVGDPLCYDKGWVNLWLSIEPDLPFKLVLDIYRESLRITRHPGFYTDWVGRDLFSLYHKQLLEIYEECGLLQSPILQEIRTAPRRT